jgi:broad specificity phosphatase PhoE
MNTFVRSTAHNECDETGAERSLGSLLMVRHGQARFLTQHYDSLSPVGRRQAALLGNYWTKLGLRFDQVYVGTHKRQHDTSEIVGGTFRRHNVSWPVPILLRELEEFPGDELLKQCLPTLLATNDKIKTRYKAFKDATTKADRFRRFQQVFELVSEMWIQGELKADDIETWYEFGQRVNIAINRMCIDALGKNIVVFTSGGVIAVTVQRALGISSQKTIELAWHLRNTSCSEFIFSEDRFTLTMLNCVSHLDETSTWTYR